MTEKCLEGKVALVTGAGRGIGKAIAIALGKSGATIIGGDINQEFVEEINNYISEKNLNGCGVVMDVTDQDSIDAALGFIKNEYSAVDILVNNAGITRDNLMLRMKQEEWDAVLNTNLSSIFKVSKACVRDMVKARWGRIVNIVSVVGIMGNAGQANYAAAKGGAIAFAKSLAQEVAPRGVTVNNIAPGFIDTKMTQQLSEEQRDSLLQLIPMKKIGRPEDIANTVTFLASDAAEYITGETINVNGGMYMH